MEDAGVYTLKAGDLESTIPVKVNGKSGNQSVKSLDKGNLMFYNPN